MVNWSHDSHFLVEGEEEEEPRGGWRNEERMARAQTKGDCQSVGKQPLLSTLHVYTSHLSD